MSDSDIPSSPTKEEMDVSENGDTSKNKEESDQEDAKPEKPAKKEEEDDDEEDDDEEPPLGLLERPVVLTSGKREKKKVERLAMSINLPNADRKKVDIQEGAGTKLGDCPRIEFKLNQTKAIDLKPLHRLLFNRAGANPEVKKNIRQFSGFTFKKGDKEFDKRMTSLNKMTIPGLKQICEVLDIERSGTKPSIIERIMDFLLKPTSSGLKVPQKKKRKSKGSADADKKGAKRKRSSKKKDSKSKANKDTVSDISDSDEEEEEEEEEEKKEKEKSKAKSESEEEEEEEEEPPKKKAKVEKKSPAKKEPAKTKKQNGKQEKAAKTEKKESKKKISDSEESDSDDEPLAAKKDEPPNNSELKDVIKKILDGANLEEVTMKTVVKQVSLWFQRLCPDSALPQDYIKALIQKAERKLGQVQGTAEVNTLLHKSFDVNFISQELADAGIDWTNIFKPTAFLPSESFQPTNDIVIALDKFSGMQNLKPDFMTEWLNRMSKGKIFSNVLLLAQKRVKEYKTLIKRKSRQPEKLETLKSEFKEDQPPFPAPKVLASSSNSKTEVERSGAAPQDATILKILHEAQKCLSEEMGEREKLAKKLEHFEYCLNGANRTIKDQTFDVAALSKENEAQRAALSDGATMQKTLVDKVTELKAEIKTLKTEQAEMKRTKLYKKIQRQKKILQKDAETKEYLAKKLNQVNEKNTQLQAEKHNLQKAKFTLKKQVETLKAQVKRLKAEKTAVIQFADNEQQVPRLETRTKQGCNEFTEDVRKTMMQLQGKADVAASKCRKVVQIVSKQLFGQSLSDADLPCVQTTINMADEGHVLSKLQLAETMLQTEHVTLHTDGTSRDHNKLVGQQISFDGYTMSLGFVGVDSENAATLLDVTVQILQELGDIYCGHNDLEVEDRNNIFKSMLKKISSAMSDRAAVMKLFNKKLQEYRAEQLELVEDKEIDVHFLYCNAHYLLGLSRACDIALKEKEKEIVGDSEGLGRDCLAAFRWFKTNTETAVSRVIRLASDIFGPRGDEKNGCRAEWQEYCNHLGKKSLVTSYRANRFNCFFESAASIIYHMEDIQTFLSSGFLSHSNLKIQSVEADLRDQRLIAPLCAVALLYIRVTAPYWQLLQSDVQYVYFHRYVQMMAGKFGDWREDSSDMLKPDCQGVFDGQFEFDDEHDLLGSVLSAAEPVEELVRFCLQGMMKELLIVTGNQLADFLPGGKFGTDPPEDVAAALQHCPLTNLVGENVFGDFDFDLHHRSSIHMWKRNRTGDWLASKGKADASSALRTARKNRHLLRKKHKQQELIVKMKIREKILENEREKKRKQIKAVEQKQNIIQAVLNHGGPCGSASDVDRLLRNSKTTTDALQKLKAEIRYQKVVLGVGGKLRLTGKCEDLSKSLKQHFGQTEETVTEPDHPKQVEADSADLEGELHLELEGSGKRKRNQAASDSDSSESDLSESELGDITTGQCRSNLNKPFCFERQGQWVSVFYDDNFYVGQVTEVKSDDDAVVTFLEKTRGRFDFFKWPASDDISEVDAKFVFAWDFDVSVVSSRVWSVPEIKNIEKTYHRLKAVELQS